MSRCNERIFRLDLNHVLTTFVSMRRISSQIKCRRKKPKVQSTKPRRDAFDRNLAPMRRQIIELCTNGIVICFSSCASALLLRELHVVAFYFFISCSFLFAIDPLLFEAVLAKNAKTFSSACRIVVLRWYCLRTFCNHFKGSFTREAFRFFECVSARNDN